MAPQKSRWVIALACLALIVLCASLFVDGRGEDSPGLSSAVLPNEAQEDMSAEPVELDLVYAYQNARWNSAIENAIQEFERIHPDIRIRYDLNYENNVYEDILSKRIARDELGDIVQMKTPEAFAAAGALGTISDEVAGLVTSVYEYDGKVYGVGVVESTTGIIYNKKIFEQYGLKEPRTYGEFLAVCDALYKKGITPIGVGGGDLWHMEFWVNHFFRTDVLMRNAHWLEDCMEGKAAWTDPEPTAMMEHLYELFASGYVNENWRMTSDSSLSYQMSEGEAAMIYTGPWTASVIKGLNPGMELGWFYVPDDEGTVCAGDNRDTFWSVTAECAADERKYEAAMTFLSWFYSRGNYAGLCRDTDTFSLAKQEISYEMTELQSDIYRSFQEADRRIATYIGNEDTPQEFEKNMLNIVQNTLAGEISVNDSLKQIQAAWEQLKAQEAGT